MEFKTYKLQELIKIKNGKDHKVLKDGNFPVFGSGGIMRYVDSFLYDKPSVLLPRKGTLNNIQYTDEPFWTVDTLYYTEVNENKANAYYLYNYLKLLDLSNLDSGTGVPSMTFDSYYNLSVNLPSLKVQNKIADILSHIDKKILINRQINRNLEELAKQIYDYWFVQFDFPNDEGKPYKSSGGKMIWNDVLKRKIPEGWEDGYIGDLFQTQPGFAFKSSDWKEVGHPVLTIKSINSDGAINIENASFIDTFDIKYQKYSTTNGNMIFAMSGNTIGKIGLISSDIDNILINQRVLIIKTTLEDVAFPYFTINDKKIQNLVFQLGANSAQPNISEEEFRSIKICFPPKNLLKYYNQYCCHFFQDIIKNRIEISTLTKLRNNLLPLLMNGQVTLNSYLSYHPSYFFVKFFCGWVKAKKLTGTRTSSGAWGLIRSNAKNLTRT